MVGWILFVFHISRVYPSSIICQCVMNMSIAAPKAEAFLRDPHRENCDCLEMALIILIHFLRVYGTHHFK
jgi:hypothetical protein